MEKAEIARALAMDTMDFDRRLGASIKFIPQDEFSRLSKEGPSTGDVLRGVFDEKITVHEDFKIHNGKPMRVLFCFARICNTPDRPGWFLDSTRKGIVCIIVSRCHAVVTDDKIRALRVLGKSKTGKSRLCEVIDDH